MRPRLASAASKGETGTSRGTACGAGSARITPSNKPSSRPFFGGVEVPAIGLPIQRHRRQSSLQGQSIRQQTRRCSHAWQANEALDALVVILRPGQVEHLQPWLPQRSDSLPLPALHFVAESRVTRGEVLCSMIAGPAIATSGAHPARGAADFVEDSNIKPCFTQSLSTRQSSNAGTNHKIVGTSIHGSVHSKVRCAMGHATDVRSGINWRTPYSIFVLDN